MILSDCFTIWAMNTWAGIHFQFQTFFFTSGKATWTGVVIPCTDAVCASLFWHGKANHITVLTKGSPISVSCRKEGCSFFLPALWWAMWFTAPSRGTNLIYYTGDNLHKNTSTSLLLTCWLPVTSSRHLFSWLQKAQTGLGLKLFPGRVRVRMMKLWVFLEQ